MEKTKLLQTFYESFINLTNPHDFFIGLADYLEYADSVPEFDRITAELTVKRKEHEDKLNELSNLAIVKLDKFKDQFEAYVKKHKIENPAIENAFKEYVAWKDGLINGSRPKVLSLHDLLCDVVRALHGLPEHKEYASKYIEFWEHDNTAIKYFLPIKEIKEFTDYKEEFDEISKSELWGQVNKLGWIFQVIKHGKTKHKELVKKLEGKDIRARSEASFELLWSYNPLYGAWKMIQDNKSTKGTIGDYFFNVDSIKPTATRLHNYILSKTAISSITNDIVERAILKLGEQSKITNPENSSLPTSFAPRLSIQGKFGYMQVFKNGKKLKIAGVGTRQFCLIKALFSPEDAIDATYTSTFQGYERVFKAITQGKDKTNSKLKSGATMKNEMCSIISWTIKELQKNKDVKDYLKFEWQNDNQIRMTIVPPEGKSS